MNNNKNPLISPPYYETPEASPDKIMGDYLHLLATDGPGVWCAADETKLPYPKAVIKRALIWALQRESNDETCELLIRSYLQLGNFQPGIGETNIGYDPTKADPALTVPERFRLVEEGSKAFEKWEDQINAEREELATELSDVGLIPPFTGE